MSLDSDERAREAAKVLLELGVALTYNPPFGDNMLSLICLTPDDVAALARDRVGFEAQQFGMARGEYLALLRFFEFRFASTTDWPKRRIVQWLKPDAHVEQDSGQLLHYAALGCGHAIFCRSARIATTRCYECAAGRARKAASGGAM